MRIALIAAMTFVLAACETAPVSDPPATEEVLADSGAGASVIVVGVVPVGTITPYAGEVNASTRRALERQGWLACDGSEVSRAQYSSLYRVIGNIHGAGDGSSTFNLPDYQGRFLRGVSGSSDRDPDSDGREPAAAGGNRGNSVGSVQGDAILQHRHLDTGIVAEGRMNVVIGAVSPEPGMIQVERGGAEGPARSETRPQNANVHYLIFTGVPTGT